MPVVVKCAFYSQWRMDIEHEDESEVPQGGWEWVKAQEEKKRKEEEVRINISG